MLDRSFQALDRYQDNFRIYKSMESELLWQGKRLPRRVDLTILIITNNRPALFYEAFQSVCTQEEAGLEWEILIMDNHPQEAELKKIISRENNQRVRYYRNKKDMGHEGNMNRGIELARGRWVALLHDDDLLVGNYLVLIQKYLQVCSHWKKPLAYIRANYLCFQDGEKACKYVRKDKIEKAKYVKPELWAETLLRGCGPTYVNSCGSVVNRKAFLEVGGYNTAVYPIGDATLGLIFMKRGYAVYETENVLGYYRQGENASIKKETMLSLLEADFYLREYLYKRNVLTHVFGILFRDAQYQASVDAKLYMAEKYQKNKDEIPSLAEISQIYPYKKCYIRSVVLKILRIMLDFFYRRGRMARIWLFMHSLGVNGHTGWSERLKISGGKENGKRKRRK